MTAIMKLEWVRHKIVILHNKTYHYIKIDKTWVLQINN